MLVRRPPLRARPKNGNRGERESTWLIVLAGDRSTQVFFGRRNNKSNMLNNNYQQKQKGAIIGIGSSYFL